jgi:phosphoribosylamine--glycine ligase
LQSDIIDIFLGIANSSLRACNVTFSNKATVCKYAVPDGYPDSPVKGKTINLLRVKNPDQLFFASVDMANDGLVEAGSRTVAVIGIADTLQEAEAIAESEINRIEGPLFHRTDIGTDHLINKRIDHMKNLRG